jgi:hypothetical protein
VTYPASWAAIAWARAVETDDGLIEAEVRQYFVSTGAPCFESLVWGLRGYQAGDELSHRRHKAAVDAASLEEAQAAADAKLEEVLRTPPPTAQSTQKDCREVSR